MPVEVTVVIPARAESAPIAKAVSALRWAAGIGTVLEYHSALVERHP